MGSLNPENEPKQELNDSGYVQEDGGAREVPPAPAEPGTELAPTLLDLSVPAEPGTELAPTLLDLSDDVLLMILQYCSPYDLKALGFTCSRLGALVLDRTLWRRVDARELPTGRRRMRWLLTHALSSHTASLKLSGYAMLAVGCLGYMSPPPEEALHATSPASCRAAEEPAPAWHVWSRECVDNEMFGPRLLRLCAQALPRYGGGLPYYAEQGRAGGPPPRDSAHRHLHLLPGHSCFGPMLTLSNAAMNRLTALCPNLAELALEDVVLDCNMIKIGMFPKTLQILSLKGTKCFNTDKSFLYKIQDFLVVLEELDVSECEWVEPACMLPLSKLPRLARLYMRRCNKLTEFVAYASLATRYGFKQLKVFDLRGSPVGDSEVSALGWLPLLEELYLSPAAGRPTTKPHEGEHHLTTELTDWELEEPEYYKSKYQSEAWIEEENKLSNNVPYMGNSPLGSSVNQGAGNTAAGSGDAPPLPPQVIPVTENLPQTSTMPKKETKPMNIFPIIELEREVKEDPEIQERRRSKRNQDKDSAEEKFDKDDSAKIKVEKESTKEEKDKYNPTKGNLKKEDPSKWKKIKDDPSKGKLDKDDSTKVKVEKEDSAKGKQKKDAKDKQDNGTRKRKPETEDSNPTKRLKDNNNEKDSNSTPNSPILVSSSFFFEGNTSNIEVSVNISMGCQNEESSNNESTIRSRRPTTSYEQRPSNPARTETTEPEVSVEQPTSTNEPEPAQQAPTIEPMSPVEPMSSDESSSSVATSSAATPSFSTNEVLNGSHRPLVGYFNSYTYRMREVPTKASRKHFDEKQTKAFDDFMKQPDNNSVELDSEDDRPSLDDGDAPQPKRCREASTSNTNDKVTSSKVSSKNDPRIKNSRKNAKSKRQESEPSSSTTNNEPNSSTHNESSSSTINEPSSSTTNEPSSSSNYPEPSTSGSNIDKQESTDKTQPDSDYASTCQRTTDNQPKPHKFVRFRLHQPPVFVDGLGNQATEGDNQPNQPNQPVAGGNPPVVIGARVAGSRPPIVICSNSQTPVVIGCRNNQPPIVISCSNNDPKVVIGCGDNKPPVVVEGCRHSDDNHNTQNNNDARQPDWNIHAPEANREEPRPPRIARVADPPEEARHRILYVNVGRRRHAMYQISMPEPVDLRTQRPLSAAMNLIYSSHLAPRLEHASLVTDAAIRRFGRADGENINYVQIGPFGPVPAPYEDPNARPNRSNLRILSATGFIHITNHSLVHLATAAPNLRTVDFTGTRVTESGVACFRNYRPNCRVKFGPVNSPEEAERPRSR